MNGSVRRLAYALGVSASLIVWACGGGSRPPGSPSPIPTASSAPLVATLVGAGDIGMCGSMGPESTAKLIDNVDGIVFTTGDNAYMNGSSQQYHDCYEPSWGRHRDRTRPAPGNHEYETAGGMAYYDYYGANAGPQGLGYYSFSAGQWHIVSLNSAISMGVGSPQLEWLKDDLAQTRAACVAAIWHHPLFSAGPNPTVPDTVYLWRALYDAGADIVINGHDHMYERFALQTPDGVADPRRGIREFVVGTGGAALTMLTRPKVNIESLITGTFGVLKLTLQPNSYSWQFLNASGSATDFGSDSCR
jgi:acid phosphatase type 7